MTDEVQYCRRFVVSLHEIYTAPAYGAHEPARLGFGVGYATQHVWCLTACTPTFCRSQSTNDGWLKHLCCVPLISLCLRHGL